MMFNAQERKEKLEFIELIFWPVAKFCIRHFYAANDLIRVFKILLLRAAAEEMTKRGEKVNVSRLSIATGIHRGEVTHLYREETRPRDDSVSVISRVIGQWRHSRKFVTKSGTPKVLTFQGDDSEFKELTDSVSTAVHSASILVELERMGAVERTKRGLRLKIQGSALGGDTKRTYQLLANELDSLIVAIEENIEGRNRPGNLHVRTEYDNIYLGRIHEIRKWLLEEGKAFHRRARNFISQFDKDLTPSSENVELASGRVVLSTFSLTVPGGDYSPSQSDSDEGHKRAKESPINSR